MRCSFFISLSIDCRILPSVGLEAKAVKPLNPFLAESSPQPTVCQLVVSAVDEMTAPRKPSIFKFVCSALHNELLICSMTNTLGKVTTLSLPKKAFRLGEDIVGSLDFQSTFLISKRRNGTKEVNCRCCSDLCAVLGELGDRREAD
jgi:hypothetical protein